MWVINGRALAFPEHDTKKVAMKFLTWSIVVGQLTLIGVLPAAAVPPVSPDPQSQSAADSDTTTGRATYTQHARGDMQEWQHKLHGFGVAAKAKGREAGDAAGNDLKAAWSKTQQESRNLQTASAEGWASAKASYEKSTHELADAWDRNRP
jgi:hypothetical protein